ncbi:MAG: magnesium chelatase domain-containing protein, partial [Gemmatimonadaceae bacterium]
LLLAVLDKRAGLSFAQLDVFVNVVGGMRLQEPAGDLAVAAALASSVRDVPLPADVLFLGEVGLGGEVRPVSQAERRIAEAANQGVARVFLAERGLPKRPNPKVRAIGVRTVQDLFGRLFA